jgi:hypothetical protein
MSNKELIISLIQQDLKHNQLVLGLDELGLEASEKHCLDILDIVANLMKVPGGHVEYDWCRLYVTFMQECKTVGVTHTTETMKPFAEACYNGLMEIINPKAFGSDNVR